MHAFLTFVMCMYMYVYMCYVWVIYFALLCFYYDISLTKKISVMKDQPYSSQRQSLSNLNGSKTVMHEKNTFFIFPSHLSPQNFQIMLLFRNVRRHISSNQLVRCVSSEAL